MGSHTTAPYPLQVIVIEKGCVVEEGTHSELLAQNGVYKQLVMRQLMTESEGAGENQANKETKQSTTSSESESTAL